MISVTKATEFSAGLAILLLTVVAGFAFGYVPGALYVSGDATTTLSNIRSGEVLFRAGTLAWMIVVILDLFLAWALYEILKNTQQALALLMAWARVLYAAVLASALSEYLDVIYLLDQAPSAPLAERVMQHISVFNAMFSLVLIVFGMHLLLLGHLVIKSGFINKILGYIILLAALGYLLNNILGILLSDYKQYQESLELIFIGPQIVGELGLGVFLIVISLSKKQPLS